MLGIHQGFLALFSLQSPSPAKNPGTSTLGTRLNKPLGKTGNFCRASQKPPGKRKNPAALPEKVLPRWKKSAAAASRWQRCQIIGGKMATGSSNDSYSL